MSKISTDIILLIFNCKKYRHKALKQKETWLKNFTMMPYFHVIGEPELETEYKFDNSENILYVKTLDDYNSLPKKVISAYSAIHTSYNYKYIFKTDDDQMITTIKFFETIKKFVLTKEPKIHYAGRIVNVTKPYLSQYHRLHPELPPNLPILQTNYCSGRFYVLSNLAVEILLTKKLLIGNEYLEDYAIGLHLDEKFKINMLPIATDKYFYD
jgi:hypothetical protein